MAASFVRAQSSLLWHTYSRALERRPLLTKIATGKWQGERRLEPQSSRSPRRAANRRTRRRPLLRRLWLTAFSPPNKHTTTPGVLGTVLGDSIAQHTARHMRERAPPNAASASTAQPPPPWRFDLQRTCRLCAYSALLGTPLAHAWFGLLDKGTLLPAFARASPGLGAACKTLLDQLLMAPIGLTLFFSSVALMEGKAPHEAVASASARLKPALIANYALWPGAQAINFALVPPRQRILYVNVVAIAWTAVLSHLASADAAAPVAAAAAGEEAAADTPAFQLPLPIPPEPVVGVEAAAGAAGSGGGGGGVRRRAAPQKQQQKAAPGEAPPDTFVPVVP